SRALSFLITLALCLRSVRSKERPWGHTNVTLIAQKIVFNPRMSNSFLPCFFVASLFLDMVAVADGQSSLQYDLNGKFTDVTAAVLGPPAITAPPINTDVVFGGDAALSVSAAASGPLTYQWYNQSSPIAGATNGTLFLTNVTFSNQGNYTV